MQYEQLPLHHFAKEIKKAVPRQFSKGIIFGNFGACNVGDEAILAGELQELSSLPTSVTVISRYPKRVKQLHNTKAVHLFRPFEILKKIIASDYVIVGGGGIFCKNDVGVRGILFQIYTLLMFLAVPLLLRKKLFLIGIGFYPNTNKAISYLARLLIKQAQVLAVRDHSSFLYLREHKLPVKEYKDSSFLMELRESPQRIWKTPKTYTVGIALNKPQNPNEVSTFVQEIAEFIKKHAATTHFVIFALDYHPLYSNDRRFAQKVLREVQKTTRVSYEFVPMHLHPQAIFSAFGKADFMLVSRLHGAIFSYRTKTPFFAISYDTKCESFLRSINHQVSYPATVTAREISAFFDAVKIEKNLPQDSEFRTERQGVSL